MLKEFQGVFADPGDHSPLAFEGTMREGRWLDGVLRSGRGETWPVRNGIPDFVRVPVMGALWTEKDAAKNVADGFFARKWRDGGLAGRKEEDEFLKIAREVAGTGAPVMDIASGPDGGFMPAVMAANPDAVVMLADAGTAILHGWKETLDGLGVTAGVCFAGFDIRRMPIASASIRVITSNVGFGNVQGERLRAVQEAARVLTEDGVIFASGEGNLERAGVEQVCTRMGWDFEEKVGWKYEMTWPEMFEKAGLRIVEESPCARERVRGSDADYALAAERLGIELWSTRVSYRLEKKR